MLLIPRRSDYSYPIASISHAASSAVPPLLHPLLPCPRQHDSPVIVHSVVGLTSRFYNVVLRWSTRFVLLCSRATTNGCGPSGVVVNVSARPRRESGVPIPVLVVSGVVVAGSVPAGVTGGAAA